MYAPSLIYLVARDAYGFLERMVCVWWAPFTQHGLTRRAMKNGFALDDSMLPIHHHLCHD